MSITTFDYSTARDMGYIRKVYAWLALGAAMCSATAWASLSMGDAVYAKIEEKQDAVLCPPTVAAICDHPYVAVGLFLTLALASIVARKAKGLSGFFYFLFTTFSGLFIGPALFIAQWKAEHEHTLSAHPIRDSFIMTSAMFGGLTMYAWTTKKDFSWMGGMLWTGLIVLIVAGFMNIFIGSTPFQLALSSVAIILFSGYILYDTQRVLSKSNGEDAIGDALNIYLDILNIFLSMLNISSAKKS
jgi:modulator of FtsH protease